jgi:uncharacterized protein YqgC (DUF456 family)
VAYAWWTGGRYLHWPGIVTVVALALVGELLEFLAGAGGAKAAGGSKRSMVFSTIGGITGGILLTIPLPIIGTIIGVCIGAFAGATLAQMTVEQDVEHSARVGLGAAKGTFIGILSKLTVGCVIFIVAAIVALPFGGAATPTPATPALPPVTPTTSPAPPATTTAPAEVPTTLPAVERE